MIKKMMIIILLLFNALTCFYYATQADYENQLEQSGANELFEKAPNGVKANDQGEFLNFSIKDIFNNLIKSIKNEITNPFKTLLLIIGMILLFSLINTFSTSFNQSEFSKVFEIVVALSIAIAILTPIIEIIKSSNAVIKHFSDFTASFLPVFCGIVVASGKVLTGGVYNSIMLGVIHIITAISASILIPFLGIYLAFNFIGSINNQININGVCNMIRNIIVWIIGISITIFIGLLSIQTIVANATDTVTMRTTKFMIGSFLPIVGGAISEAFNSIQGCLSLIKSTVGTFGIICFLSLFLPIIIKITVFIFVIIISSTVSEIFENTTITKVLKACSNTLIILLSLIISILVFVIIATTILLSVTGGL
jgi:stage III sporulation protein AE